MCVCMCLPAHEYTHLRQEGKRAQNIYLEENETGADDGEDSEPQGLGVVVNGEREEDVEVAKDRRRRQHRDETDVHGHGRADAQPADVDPRRTLHREGDDQHQGDRYADCRYDVLPTLRFHENPVGERQDGQIKIIHSLG